MESDNFSCIGHKATIFVDSTEQLGGWPFVHYNHLKMELVSENANEINFGETNNKVGIETMEKSQFSRARHNITGRYRSFFVVRLNGPAHEFVNVGWLFVARIFL